MRIYWIEGGKKCGPASVPDIISKVELGELSPDTLGWYAGCSGWAPLRELPALADFLHPQAPEAAAPAEADTPEPAPAKAPAEDTAAEKPAPPEQGAAVVLRSLLPAPSARLLARLVDMAIYAALAMFVLHMAHAPYNRYYLPGTPLFWLPMPILEALLLYCFRTTPGKRWMGINLQSLQGTHSYPRLLLRSVLVFVLGMGCLIMPISLIAMALSAYMLYRRGITLWDLRVATLPIQTRRPQVLSVVASAFLIFICLQLCGSYMLDWMPDMLEDARANFPDFVPFLEDVMNRLPE